MAISTKATSVLTGGANSKLTTAAEINAMATDFINSGVVGSLANTNGVAPMTGGFAVNAHGSPDMGVAISGGQIYITTTPVGQASQNLRTSSASIEDVTIANNATGVTKFDWIYAKNDPTIANTPDTPGVTITTFVTSRSSNSATDDGGNTPTYGKLLAIVTVANGAVSISNANIRDMRTQASVSAPSSAVSSTNGWSSLPSNVFSYLANNGNKDYTLTTPSDVTSFLTPGMKMRFDRSVAPPTQCMSFLSASSQYATKAAPTGAVSTFTGPFSAESWIYLLSYTGAAQSIITRRNGSVGNWGLIITGNAGVAIRYGDAGGNFTEIDSLLGLPLNRWIHAAGVVTSVSGKTGAIYINGASVSTVNSLNSATTLVQTGNLSIGCQGAGAGDFFNGYLSETRVWSQAQSQANIQANMNISLVGNEAGLAFLAKGNGSFNDSTTAANNLTATNGASATQAFSGIGNGLAPANSTEFGYIISSVFSGGLTTIHLFTGSAGNIPNATITNPFFSTSAQPYGFPDQSTFKLDAFDSTGTTTNALATLLLRYVTNNPIDNMRWPNPAGTGGIFYLNQVGTLRSVSGLTNSFATSTTTTSQTLTFPTGFFTSIISTSITVSSVSTVAQQFPTGNSTSTTAAGFYIFCQAGSGGAVAGVEVKGT